MALRIRGPKFDVDHHVSYDSMASSQGGIIPFSSHTELSGNNVPHNSYGLSPLFPLKLPFGGKLS
jgi:hypothetical protein